jgi:iron complex outermembrane receptor protein
VLYRRELCRPGTEKRCAHLAFAPVLVVLLVAALAAPAAWPQQKSDDLTSESLEDLMNIQVTSVSKKAENLSNAAAAIFVITGEDIRRGGFSSIPDALRMVPGLHVAQQNAHVWVVAARGFSSVFNRDMLVLIDGRLVYTPLFGGVWWDVQDPPLEDIDRIEVIRGPGGTLWGADAVNGVINIVTKKAENTQGPMMSTSAGVDEGYEARVRYGGTLGNNFAYRVYGTSNDWFPTVNATGAPNYDAWSFSQGGMRFDWKISPRDTLTFDGQGYSGRTRDAIDVFSPTAPPALLESSAVVKGGHVLGRWSHNFSDRSSTDVLGYCDWTDRNTEGFIEPRNTCDIEFQHNHSFAARQSLIWGGEVLTTRATEQDDFTTTGFQYQPQIRVVWTPRKSQNVWVAISRVVRDPNTAERSLVAPISEPSTAPPTFPVLIGNPDVDSEVEHAFEAGYRYIWKDKFSLDGAIYYNDFYRLIGNSPGAPVIHPSPFYISIPLTFNNLGPGQTHGLELYLKYTPIKKWTISTGITQLRGNSVPNLIVPPAANDFRQQVNVQSRLDLTRHVNFDASYYYYDAIPPALPPVNRVDVGVSTKSIRGFTFSVWGRNLQADRHPEETTFILPAGEIRRSVVFKLIWEPNAEQKTASH